MNKSFTIGAVRERAPGEHRVALAPETAKKFLALGAQLLLENTLGLDSLFMDSTYEAANENVTFSQEALAVYRSADLILRVTPPSLAEIAALPEKRWSNA
jgi:NAD(P) transhydrogenase subunit alpha